MAVGKWNYETLEYEPYELPIGAARYSNNMDRVVACAECGRKILYGDGYGSRRIHVRMSGMSYVVCPSCYKVERDMETEYRDRRYGANDN